MATWNDITGDLLVSRVLSKKGEEAFEEIFGKRKTNGGWTPPPLSQVASAQTTTDKPVELWTEADEKRLEVIGHNGNIGYGDSDLEAVPSAAYTSTQATED